MLNIPFTPDCKKLLETLGFTHKHHPESWEDVGGPENGPKVVGHHAFDSWEKDDYVVYVQDGHIQEVEQLPPEFVGPFGT